MENTGEKVYRNKVFEYAENFHGDKPEYLWEKHPGYAVLRHKENRKWYAVVMDVPRKKLGLEGEGKADILVVKSDPTMIGSLLCEEGFLPAYHMNKSNWISALLDGTVSDDDIVRLIKTSFDLTR